MRNWKRAVWLLLVLLATGIPLYVLSVVRFALFHFVIEFFAVLVGFMIFTVSNLSRRFSQNSFLTRIGPGFLTASLISALHLAAYEGMSILPGSGSDLTSRLWLLQSFMLSVSLLVAILDRTRKDGHWWRMGVYLSIGVVVVLLAYLDVLPTAFVEGVGPTAAAVIGRISIIALYVASFVLLFRWKRGSDDRVREAMTEVLVLLVLSEVLTFPTQDVTGLLVFASHFLRLLAFYLLYSAVVVEGIQKPYRSVFSELNELSRTDGLTKLYNHRYFLESVNSLREKAAATGKEMYLMVFDIDRFKAINDTYGHTTGDKVLQEVAGIVRKRIRSHDVACRQGGDEFSVILYDVPMDDAQRVVDRFRAAFLLSALTEEGIHLTISGGVVRYCGESTQELLTKADHLLYTAKKDGRNRVYFSPEPAGTSA